MRKYFFVSVLISFGIFFLFNTSSSPKAFAAVCPTTGTDLSNVFPRNLTGTREEHGCTNADSFIWMSDYYSGSPLQTPNAKLRVFFRLSEIASMADPIDQIRLYSPDASRVRCGFSMRAYYINATGTQTFDVTKPGATCAWSTSGGFVPGAFNVYKSQLFSDVAKYGPDIRYVDVQMSMLVTNSSAPFRVWARGAGSVAKITFQEQTLAEAQTSGNYNTGGVTGAFAIWTNDIGGGTQERITYTLRFKPDCSILPESPVSAYLKWYDADGPTSVTQPYIFRSYVTDDTTGTRVWEESSTSYNFGGDNEYRQSPLLTFRGGHSYRWQFAIISRNNGVQLVMPFSEINSEINCNGLPSGSIVANCSVNILTVTVNATDPDGGTPGVNVAIAGSPAIANKTSVGASTYGGRSQDGVTYTVSGLITDAQTGQAVVLANDTYDCPVPAAGLACGAMSLSVSSPIAGQTFTASPRVQYSSGGSGSLSGYTMRITAPSSVENYSGTVIGYSPNPITPIGVFAAASPVNLTYGTEGTYTVSWSLSNGTITANCNQNIIIAFRPLAKFFGGDIQSGGAFSVSGTCTSPPSASRNALGFLRNSGVSNTYVGTSSQLGVFALENINGIRSAGQRSPSVAPNTLAFANSGVTSNAWPASGSFGGSFGSSLPCAEDYYSDISSSPTTSISAGQNLSTLANGRYSIAGGATYALNTGTGIPDGRELVVYIDGSVYLTGATFGYQNTSWSNVSSIPSLFIIAKGNIYISPTITRMDGVYVAQSTNPDPSVSGTGEIFTCSGTGGDYEYVRPTLNTEIITGCANQLLVNGSFIAEKVHLLRTQGSLSSPSSAATNAEIATSPATWSNNAEIFRYTPELYVRTNRFLRPSSSATSYDAITSLAPAL